MSTGQDNTILFIHGAPLGGWMWQPFIPHLSEYQCLMPDLPEHAPETVGTPFSLTSSVESLVRVIQPHTTRPVHVVGISLGGLVALELVRQHPELVASAVLSSTSLGPLPAGRIISALSAPITWLTKSRFGRNQTAKQLHVPDAIRPQFDSSFGALTPALFRRVNDSIHNYRVSPELLSIQKRILVLCGEQEPGFVKNNQKRLLEHLSNAEGYIVPAGGHTWCYEDPAFFVEVVRQWFMGQPLPEKLLPLT